MSRAESVAALSQLATRPPLSSHNAPFIARVLYRLRAILANALTSAAPTHLQDELPVAVRAARALVLMFGNAHHTRSQLAATVDAATIATESSGRRQSVEQQPQEVFSSTCRALEDQQQALTKLLDAHTEELCECLVDLIERAISLRVDSHQFNRFTLTALAFDALSVIVPEHIHLLSCPGTVFENL